MNLFSPSCLHRGLSFREEEAYKSISREIEKIFQQMEASPVKSQNISQEIEKILDSIERMDSHELFCQILEEKNAGQNLRKVLDSLSICHSQSEFRDSCLQAKEELVRLQNAITKITESLLQQKRKRYSCKKKFLLFFSGTFFLCLLCLSFLIKPDTTAHPIRKENKTAESEESYSVQGKIVDPAGERVPYADFVLRSREGEIYIFQSDEQGKFHFVLPKGHYYCIVQAKGFRSYQTEILLVKEENMCFVLSLP